LNNVHIFVPMQDIDIILHFQETLNFLTPHNILKIDIISIDIKVKNNIGTIDILAHKNVDENLEEVGKFNYKGKYSSDKTQLMRYLTSWCEKYKVEYYINLSDSREYK